MNYTTIEQSKHLLSLGISPESADMCYIANSGIVGINVPFVKDTEKEGDIPCWSIGALLKILQQHYNIPSEYWIDLWISGIFIGKGHETIKEYRFDNDIITPFYEVICWMLENHYI